MPRVPQELGDLPRRRAALEHEAGPATGVSRRDFLRYSVGGVAVLCLLPSSGCGGDDESRAEDDRTPLLWVETGVCTGCACSLLDTFAPSRRPPGMLRRTMIAELRDLSSTPSRESRSPTSPIPLKPSGSSIRLTPASSARSIERGRHRGPAASGSNGPSTWRCPHQAATRSTRSLASASAACPAGGAWCRRRGRRP
jgi:hypothetical protein